MEFVSVRFISYLLLSTYGLLALLGHGGMHALCGGSDSCCAAGGHAACESSGCRSDACQHDLQRCPFHNDGVEREGEPKSKVPQRHDSRNCRICEWHLKTQAVACEAVTVDRPDAVLEMVTVSCVCEADATPLRACTRGPPARMV